MIDTGRPRTGWQKVKVFATLLFAVAMLVWNGWWIIHGITTGEVETLKRHASYLIYEQNEPGWFAVNIVIRVAVEFFFGIGLPVYFRKVLNYEARGLK